MKVGIFQFNGCDKCFNETLLIPSIIHVSDPKNWKEEELDVAVVAGYLTPEDITIIEKIKTNAKKIIAYGSCAVSGGVYGLSYQKGNLIVPTKRIVTGVVEINGCLAEVDELKKAIDGEEYVSKKKLCDRCSRKSTCDYLDEVMRSIDLEEGDDSCFNDLGFMCNGYIARECKELCVNYGAPCRGCKPLVDRPGFRMLGMFGTLMGNIEVATEATGKGGTDKLADEDDDVTNSFPDVTGSFFRFNLANTVLPIGRNKSDGLILTDIFVGRPIEEIPLITGLLGGSKSISFTFNALEAYEKGAGIEISDKTKELRKKLLELEKNMNGAIKKQDSEAYKKARSDIVKISGNMNLSNLFFGGFRTSIEGEDYEQIKYHVFDFDEEQFDGTYECGPVKYTLNTKGIITEFKMEV